MKKSILLVVFLTFFAGFNLSVAGEPVKLGPHIFGELRARSIGPAAMSGRISALDVGQVCRPTGHIPSTSCMVYRPGG